MQNVYRNMVAASLTYRGMSAATEGHNHKRGGKHHHHSSQQFTSLTKTIQTVQWLSLIIHHVTALCSFTDRGGKFSSFNTLNFSRQFGWHLHLKESEIAPVFLKDDLSSLHIKFLLGPLGLSVSITLPLPTASSLLSFQTILHPNSKHLVKWLQWREGCGWGK